MWSDCRQVIAVAQTDKGQPEDQSKHTEAPKNIIPLGEVDHLGSGGFRAMLYCAVLCCAVLCCAVLCHAVLC